jgi:hypothetical protein
VVDRVKDTMEATVEDGVEDTTEATVEDRAEAWERLFLDIRIFLGKNGTETIRPFPVARHNLSLLWSKKTAMDEVRGWLMYTIWRMWTYVAKCKHGRTSR